MTLSTDELWARFGGTLRAWLRRRVDDASLADDLVHEVFARVHRGLDGLADAGRVGAWLARIANHVLLDHQRARGREARALARDPRDPDQLAAAPGVEDGGASRELARCMPDFVAALPAADRRALQLFEVEGLSVRDVARRLGLTVPATKSRLRRARQRMRGLLEACCAIEHDARGGIVDYRRKRPGCGPVA